MIMWIFQIQSKIEHFLGYLIITRKSLKAWSKTTNFKTSPLHSICEKKAGTFEVSVMEFQQLSLIDLKLVFEIPTIASNIVIVEI